MCRKLANTRLSRVVSRDYVRHLADFPSFLEIQSACPIANIPVTNSAHVSP